VPIASDLQEAEALLAAGRADDARLLARERLLPASHAPRVVEARERLKRLLSA
jgi:hypothetical protein